MASLLLFGSLGGGAVLERRLTPNLPDIVICTDAGVVLRLGRDSHYLSPFLFGDYEPESGRVLRRILRPGDLVLDAGANIGWYAALFGRAVGPAGRVVAFEPLAHFARAARETVALNTLESTVEIVESGLGATVGDMVIHTFSGLPGGHASGSDLGRGDAERHLCPATTVDEHLHGAGIGRVDLLKADVEGFEREVFRGAMTVLGRDDAPVVHFEINQGCLRARGLTPADTFEPLRAAGYEALWRIDQTGRAVELSEPLPTADGDYVAAKGDAVTRVRAALKPHGRGARA